MIHIRIPEEYNLIHKFSSLKKLVRITAWWLRYIKNLKSNIYLYPRKKKLCVQNVNYQELYIESYEIKHAELWWTRHSQKVYFHHEYSLLSKGLPISQKSCLLRLNPVFDQETQCLRVGGRLKHANLDFDEKYPFILSNESIFTKLLILDRHLKSLHGGTQLTLSIIRESHWIINGRRAVRSVITSCVKCIRFNATAMTQQMGNLPHARVNPSYPFSHVGIDYAGPIKIRASSGRGIKSCKAYIVVFVCLSTKAVHLDLSSSYDTKHFLYAFKGFVSRRGLCTDIYSDCGTNFVGADRELRALFNKYLSHSSKIRDDLSSLGINWHFNPPSSPNLEDYGNQRLKQPNII